MNKITRRLPPRARMLLSAMDNLVHVIEEDGGPGSGNWGHHGRPGKVGGSGKGGGKAFRSGSRETGYSSFTRHAEFKGLAKSALSAKSSSRWIASMSEQQKTALHEQYQACGTKESEKDYNRRMFEMLSGKPEPKSPLPDNWREQLDIIDRWHVEQELGDTDDFAKFLDEAGGSGTAFRLLKKVGGMCDWDKRMIDRDFENLSDAEKEDLNFLLDQFPWNDDPKYAHIPSEDNLNAEIDSEVRKYYLSLKAKSIGIDVNVPPKPEGIEYLQKNGPLSQRLAKQQAGIVRTQAGDATRKEIKRLISNGGQYAERALSGCPPELREKIIASVDNMDDRAADLVMKALPHAEVYFSEGKGETCYHHDGNYITIYTENLGSSEDAEQTYWHEFGHFLDNNSDKLGMRVQISPLSGEIEIGGPTALAAHSKAYTEAMSKDLTQLLDRCGLSDRYRVQVKGRDAIIHRISDNQSIDVFSDDGSAADDKFAITNAVNDEINRWCGYEEATNYLKDHGEPQPPQWSDYFESYYTPKRNLYRTREKFKGASDEFNKKALEAGKARDEWIQSLGEDGYQRLLEERSAIYQRAEERHRYIGSVTDSLDEGLYGLLGMTVLHGGHSIDYYRTHTHGVETTANVFSAMAAGKQHTLEAFKSFMPNMFDCITRAWRLDGP